MAKSTILIPIDFQGNVPHWCENKSWCEQNLKWLTEQKERGYENNPNQTKEHWEKWIEWRINGVSFIWREPWEFVDTFKIVGYSRGRSAANFDLVSETTGMECSMFMTDATHLITTTVIDKGVVTGKWIFCKRGSNYGIKYLGSTDCQTQETS